MGLRLLHCADYHPNCSKINTTVDANPDIAGIGVIVGFLTTTCLAFLIAFTVLFLDRYAKIVNLIRKHITQRRNPTNYEDDPLGPYWRSPGFWSRVLSKNLLSFSDTQLLTGLAIQFTAMLQHCKLTIYHFQIVTELAFLTTVTHLLTVVTLRNYFVKYRWINLPRIFSMLGNLALLGYTSFVAYSYDIAGLELSSSLACFYKGQRPPFKAAFGGRWAALLVGAIGGHVTVIAAMYFLPETVLQSPARKWKGWKWFGAIFRTWFIAPIYAVYGFVMAGISLQKTQALGSASVVINGSEKEWGFGQFLPILLLALPLFAAWESFWEEKDEDRDNRFSRSTRPSQTSQIMLQNMPANKMPRADGHSTRDNSPLERTIESNGPSPTGTPRQMPTSRGSSLSPHPTPLGSPNLEIPRQPASPRLIQTRTTGSNSSSGTGQEQMQVQMQAQ
ncbi:uncharacterized protein BDR25DRAFT_234631 [Lindgomyces ingoldianus]|uniref:Uncharacterized protein n=1 Tax=Lindgomyces ingoldianus TaxID=673940 RepID=A0ACB6QKD7_9PLEO|nr:uncharacterized protein BDR25DRAFT_234631 [Lindgomyces ingoldianus]KAF2467424.1 hypothetical protein BDR25DRAFT_234631 [Lindgomyces ingoldianus]